MPNVTINGAEVYNDCRTEATWNAVTKVIPMGFMCVAFVTENNTTVAKLKIGDGVSQFSALPYIGGDIDMSDVNTAIATALASYYTSAQTDSAISTAISAALASVYSLKGRVDTVSDLPATGNKTGDVYMVGAVESLQKDEYYWTGTAWEFFGRTIDMSAYYTKSEIDTLLAAKADTSALPDMTQYYTKTESNTLLGNKVDKVTGKQLSTEDYTTAEKSKLAGLSNYDDTALRGRVSAIEADYLKSTDKLIINCQLDTTTQQSGS